MPASNEIIDAWPTCPECGQARHAICQLCGAVRDFFPPAYQQDDEPDGLKFCATCDDVAELKYLRQCHMCGHDYGSGYEPPTEPPRVDETRAWIVLCVLVAGSAALGIYFYFLFRR